MDDLSVQPPIVTPPADNSTGKQTARRSRPAVKKKVPAPKPEPGDDAREPGSLDVLA